MAYNKPGSEQQVPLSSRAAYEAMQARKRQARLRMEMAALAVALVAALAIGIVALYSSLTKEDEQEARGISCASFPQYCVPLVGGSADPVLANTETEASRKLDQKSQGADGVVRGVRGGTMPFIGDPSAPIELAFVSSFSCDHCREFHNTIFSTEVQDFALSGRAIFRSVLIPTYNIDYSGIQAAFCAGEQGAYWEMESELFRIAWGEDILNVFTMPRFRQLAEGLNLDPDALEDCISSGRYMNAINVNYQFALDWGLTVTPSVFARRTAGGPWVLLNFSYESIETAIQSVSRQ